MCPRMKENIIISDPKNLEGLKSSFSKGGAEKIYVLADFDRTLTKACVDGKPVPSMLSVLRDGDYLVLGYAEEAHRLYDKYHGIETDNKIPFEEKKKLMEEWWTRHFELLIKSGLNKNDIEKVVASGRIQFRPGAAEFIDLLSALGIPLVIMSSSGLGGEGIELFLKKEERSRQNIYIICNSFEWDENGKATAVRKPIIHGMNKDQTLIQNFPAFEAVKERNNIFLLGDNIEDIGMATGFNYSNILKVGFLNSEIEKNLENYKQNFDVVITNDADMFFVGDLLREITK